MRAVKLIAFVSVLVVALLAVPMIGEEIHANGTTTPPTTTTVYKGYCGSSDSYPDWEYDTSSKKLTISGTESSIASMSTWEITTSNVPSSWDMDDVIDGDEFDLDVNASNITSLGTVFKGTDVKTIDFGNITTIPASGFEGCTSLTEVVFTSKMTSIGSNAFKGCTNLSSVSISSTITKIESGAFEGCTKLTSITIPKNVVTLGSGCFKGCVKLATISITAPVSNATSVLREIPSSAFEGCTSLTSYTIPSHITTLGASCFKGCTALTSISFGSSTTPAVIKTIPESAFEGCSALATVNLNDNVETIAKNAFKGITATSIDLKKVKSVHQDAFAGASRLAKFTVGTGNTTYATDTDGKFLYSADKKTLYMVANTVTGLLDADDIGSSVRTIYLGYAAVHYIFDCTSTDYTFKKEATSPKAMGILYSHQGVDGTLNPTLSTGNKFSMTYKLHDGWADDKWKVTGATDAKVTENTTDGSYTITFTATAGGSYDVFPVGVKSITKAQLMGLTSVGDILVGEVNLVCNTDNSGNITEFTSYSCVITGYTGTGAVSLSPKIMTQYGVECDVLGITGTAGFGKVTSVTVTGAVPISDFAFQDCFKLGSVRMDDVTSIGEGVFRYCTSLTSVDLPACTTVGENAFEGCAKLRTVLLDKVTSVDDDAFTNSGVDVVVVSKDSTLSSAGDAVVVNTDFDAPLTYSMEGSMLVVKGITSFKTIGYAFDPTGAKTDVEVQKGGLTAIRVGSEDVVYLTKADGAPGTKCMVVLETMGGSKMDPVVVDSGKKVSEFLKNPSRDGYSFKGWFTDVAGTVPVSSTSTVTSSAVYYAMWEAEEDSPNLVLYTVVSLVASIAIAAVILFVNSRMIRGSR